MARSLRRSAWGCGSGSRGFCSGRSAMAWRSGPPNAIRTSSRSCAGTCAFPVISTCEERAMMNLREYRNSNARLSDYLPWAALVDHGIVLNKDGSLQRSARFRGPDMDSAVPAELVAVAGRLNNALRRLGSGWAVFVEAFRYPSQLYPASQFPDPASALVEAERRAQFQAQGAHFESNYFLTFVYLPPSEDASRAERWLRSEEHT